MSVALVIFVLACCNQVSASTTADAQKCLETIFSSAQLDKSLFSSNFLHDVSIDSLNAKLVAAEASAGTFERIENSGGEYFAVFSNSRIPAFIMLEEDGKVGAFVFFPPLSNAQVPAAEVDQVKIVSAFTHLFQAQAFDESLFAPGYGIGEHQFNYFRSLVASAGTFERVIQVRGAYIARFSRLDELFFGYVTDSNKIAGINIIAGVPHSYVDIYDYGAVDLVQAFGLFTSAATQQYATLIGDQIPPQASDQFEMYLSSALFPGFDACYVLRNKGDASSTHLMCAYRVSDNVSEAERQFDSISSHVGTNLPTGWTSRKTTLVCGFDIQGTTIRSEVLKGGQEDPLVRLALRTNPFGDTDILGKYMMNIDFSRVPVDPNDVWDIPIVDVASQLAEAEYDNDGKPEISVDKRSFSLYPQVVQDFLLAHERAHFCLGHIAARRQAEGAGGLPILEKIRQEYAADRAAVIEVASTRSAGDFNMGIDELVNSLNHVLSIEMEADHPLPSARIHTIIDIAEDVRGSALDRTDRALDSLTVTRVTGGLPTASQKIADFSASYSNSGSKPIECTIAVETGYSERTKSLSDEWSLEYHESDHTSKTMTIAPGASYEFRARLRLEPGVDREPYIWYPDAKDPDRLIRCNELGS